MRHAADRSVLGVTNWEGVPMSSGSRLSRHRTVVEKKLGFYEETYADLLDTARSQGLSLPLYLELLSASVRGSDGALPVLAPQLTSMNRLEEHNSAA